MSSDFPWAVIPLAWASWDDEKQCFCEQNALYNCYIIIYVHKTPFFVLFPRLYIIETWYCDAQSEQRKQGSMKWMKCWGTPLYRWWSFHCWGFYYTWCWSPRFCCVFDGYSENKLSASLFHICNKAFFLVSISFSFVSNRKFASFSVLVVVLSWKKCNFFFF